MNLSSVFGDHMVLQREMPVPVWGWAAPGEEITVSFTGQTARAVADQDGSWRVTLAPLAAGGPFDLRVAGRESVRMVTNVLVGEVWVASGQSNMEMPLFRAGNAVREIYGASFDRIRLLTVGLAAAVDPSREVRGHWRVCSPKTAGTFSAAAYFFGRELHRQLGVPIGLINASAGGTPAESWTSRDALLSLPAFRDVVERYERGLVNFERAFAAYQAAVQAEEAKYPAEPANVGFAEGWAAPETDVSDWGTMPVPSYWQSHGLKFNGVVWFRRDIELPAAWAGKELRLNLCPCDKFDTTYFNNVQVGAMGRENPDAWRTPRAYTVPAGVARPGRNTVAVRVYSHIYSGGIMGSAADLDLGPVGAPESERLRLWGDWRYKVEQNAGTIQPREPAQPLGPGHIHAPYGLFNGMIAPLIPCAIRGVIWYQGENNRGAADQYHALFAALIGSWRRAWGQREFPFLFVQLPNFQESAAAPAESCWAALREAQRQTLRVPGTGMAVTIDLGDPADLHPQNKQDVGHRLAQLALHQVYGREEIVPSGPLVAGASREGASIRVRFTHAGGGLVARGGPLTGFDVAGRDGRFVAASAVIEGEAVVVASGQVPDPVAVRYAWADNPVASLDNQAGLPASPFRARVDDPGGGSPVRSEQTSGLRKPAR